MSKEIYISSTPHETRLAIVENDELAEIYYERENEYTLAGSIYNGKVTRVLPGMQSSFVDIGLERDAFLYITDFMEEAGDSADFETNGNGGEARAPRESREPREARPEGQRDGGRRDGRDGRGDRGGDRRSGDRNGDRGPRPEPTDADLFNAAVSSMDPARPLSSERSDRGGDRNRRGGRNRGGRNSDGSPRRDRTDAPAVPIVRSEEPADEEYFRPDTPTLHVTPLTPPAVDSEGTEFVGEGAPGADGSRRWRGRRGRRGGRGPGRDQATPVAGQSEIIRTDDPSYVDYDRLDIDASAAPPVVPIAPPVQAEAAFVRPEQGRNDRGDRDRNDRGGRDRNDRGGRDRGGRNDRGGRDRNDRGDRGPRGFAPRTPYAAEGSSFDAPVYGRDVEPDAPVGEPIILPGESLGKYRKGGDAPVASTSAVTPTIATPAPSTEFTLPGSWDGGAVLPGETIRPRGASAGSREDRSDRSDRDRGFRGDRNDRGDRGFRGDREPRQERQQFAPVGTPEPRAEASHAVEPIHSTFVAPPPIPEGYDPELVEVVSEEPLAYAEAPVETEPQAVSEPVMVADEPVAVDAAPEPVEEPTPAVEQEYEPSEASASYRVDPVPPREFRQAGPPVLEPETEAMPETATIFGEPVPVVELHSDVVEPEVQAHPPIEVEEVVALPQLTSISETGEMHSEPPFDLAAPEAGNELPPMEVPEPTAPIYHEAAIVHDAAIADAAIVEAAIVHESAAVPETEVVEEEEVDEQEFGTSAPAPLNYFAPGMGLLEEEEMDDEDDLPALHGSAASTAYEEFEGEETLEGAADLGTMIREMSIDEITRSPEAEEEDDFDDDFLEEDQDYTLEEGDLDDSEDSGSDLDGENAAFANDEDFVGEYAQTEGFTELPVEGAAPGERTDGRREGRRDGRRGDRNRRSGRSGRDRQGSGSGERPAFSERGSERGSERSSGDHGRRDGRGGRSAQSTNLPAISDLLKPGQEILCQIAKEPIAKKGARITSHIALPGRFLVFMPTVNHTGVSRKIESDSERRRLKEILLSEKGDAAGGFIVRTAASGASEDELRSDLRFLLNLWADIKARSESSKSPALIYHDLNLVERVLRDQVTDTFSAIWVDTETEYERVLRFLQRFQPSLIRRVKLYTKETPLFEQFGITEEINKALRSKVWLKSGGSIVINQTEALVAIDINTGKYVGKTARLEDTIVKTNLDAIPEIVRQIRLRDLGGIIIIDFIDMDERKNRNRVMAALEEELKNDRAPSKVLQFNDFGLVAITRKRVKQSLERTLSTTCGICAGTGMVKSPITVCNDIYIEMRKMHKHLERGDVMLRVNPEVVKQLKAPGTKWLQEMEEMVGKTILVKSDPSLHPEQFDIH